MPGLMGGGGGSDYGMIGHVSEVMNRRRQPVQDSDLSCTTTTASYQITVSEFPLEDILKDKRVKAHIKEILAQEVDKRVLEELNKYRGKRIPKGPFE